MKMICALLFAVALGTTACKSREFNTQAEQESITTSNGDRVAFAGVLSPNDAGSGWCYFNEDKQFQLIKIESERFEVEARESRETMTRTVKKFKVDYTLRQYRSAHSNALRTDNLYGFLNGDGVAARAEAGKTFVNQVLTEVMRSALTDVVGTLCSEETLNAAGQIPILTTDSTTVYTYRDFVAQCRNGKTEIVKVPGNLVNGSAFQWLVGELKKYSSNTSNSVQNLKCPTVMQQIETTRGALVGTKTCKFNEICEP